MTTVDIYARSSYHAHEWVPSPISRYSPVLEYDLSLDEFLILRNHANLIIYASGTKTAITMDNIKDFFPEYDDGSSSGGGGGGSSVDGYTKAQVDAKISSVNTKINNLNTTKANKSDVYTKTEITNNYYTKTEVDTLLTSNTNSGSSTLQKELVASETIGVVTPGKTYAVGTDLETIIRDILIKYTKPGCSLAITPSTTLYDAVTGSISSVKLTAVVKKNTKDIVNVKFYVNDTAVKTITTNVKSGGTFTYTYTPSTPIKQNIKFSASASDDQSTTTSNVNVVFIGKSYYGTVGSDISQPTATQVKALNNTLKNSKAYTYSGITMTYGKVVYAYPKSLGTLTKIMDNENNVNYTTSFARTELKIDNIDYYVYTQIDPSAADNIKIDFT